MIKKCVKNCTDFDYLQFMNLEEIYDAEEYFDMNKLITLKDKFKDQQVQALLQKVIVKCKSLSKKYNVTEYIKQSNLTLLELAKDPETTPDVFSEAANKLKLETGYDVWVRIG